MTTQRILIVEDEPSIAELISINLSHAGFEVDRAFQADQAAVMMKETLPCLLILDWMLPGKSGVQFAKELRNSPKTASLPILMLTAKGEELDKVQGLNAGADDFVTKPFSPKELVARVNALLRRQAPAIEERPLAIGPLKLDPVAHRLMATLPDASTKAIALGPTEYRLLHFLMSNPERVHSRSALLDRVWGNEVYIEERTVECILSACGLH